MVNVAVWEIDVFDHKDIFLALLNIEVLTHADSVQK